MQHNSARRAESASVRSCYLIEGLEQRVLMAAGQLDPTFGNGGIVLADRTSLWIEGGAAAAVWQADGKLLVAGGGGGSGTVAPDLELRRYNADGSLDPTFGIGGKVLTDVSPHALAIQPDGKILAAGSTHQGSDLAYALARYNPDGSLDSTFGNGGTFISDIGSECETLAVQPDGRIVLAGRGTPTMPGGTGDFTVARVDAAGNLDTSFGPGHTGFEYLDFTYDDVATDVALLPDGSIVLGGNAHNKFAVARLHSDGTPDSTFGSGGMTVVNLPGVTTGQANMVVLPDGNVLIGGDMSYSQPNNGYYAGVMLARLNPDATLDTSYASGGVLTLNGTYLSALALAPDQKLLLCGESFPPGKSYVQRLNPDGTTDASFGTNGQVQLPVGGNYYPTVPTLTYNAIAVRGDGEIALAGLLYVQSPFETWAVVRLHPNGSADTTFSPNGLVAKDPAGIVGAFKDAVVTPDGKTIAVGSTPSIAGGDDMLVARFNPDGSPDPTFGNAGTVVLDIAGDVDVALGVAVQADGRIVLAGNTGRYFYDRHVGYYDAPLVALVRLNPDGSLDNSFGSGGIVTTDFTSGADDFAGVALTIDGRIVVAGTAYSGNADSGYAGTAEVARYNPDGSLDGSFGQGGKVLLPLSASRHQDDVWGVAVQNDGKVVLAGDANSSSQPRHAAVLLRLSPDGTPDPTFGSNGLTTLPAVYTFIYLGTPQYSTDAFHALTIQPDGKIVAAGSAIFSNSSVALLARFNPDGSLDGGFGSGGKVVKGTSGNASNWEFFSDVTLQADGKLVAAGTTNLPPGATTTANVDAFASRYEANGSPDAAFGTGGVAATPLDSNDIDVTAVAWGPDGKITVAGDVDGHAGGDRYLNVGRPLLLRFQNDYVPPGPPPVPNPTYVSDLTPLFSQNGWGPVEKDQSVGGPGAGDGQTLTIGGQTFAKGLGTNAYSEVIYDLGGRYGRFLAQVGVDDEVGDSAGTVVFQIWSDGTLLYESGLLTGADGPRPVSIDVTGRGHLQLAVLATSDGGANDHADWADAKLLPPVAPDHAPSVNTFAAGVSSPVTMGQNLPLTVTATDPDGESISKVSFFEDRNQDGVADPGELIGTDWNGLDGWNYSCGTFGRAAGSLNLLAVAYDAQGLGGAPRSLRVELALPGVAPDAGSVYMLTGAAGAESLFVARGSVRVAQDLSTAFPKIGLTISNGGSVTLNSVQHFSAVDLSDGAALTAAGGPLSVGNLTIDGTSSLDLGSNDLLVDRTLTPAYTIRYYLAAGYANGTWAGTGIRSGNAASDPSHFSLGYADGGATSIAPAGQVLVRYTRRGDANLDGKVDIQDLLILRSNAGTTFGAQWWQGDSNFDGKVDIQDLLAFRANVGSSVP